MRCGFLLHTLLTRSLCCSLPLSFLSLLQADLEAADAAEAAEAAAEVEPDAPVDQPPNEDRPVSENSDFGDKSQYQPLPIQKREEGKHIVSKYDQKDL